MDKKKPSTDPGARSHLSEVEERMRSIVDHVVDGIISIDERGTITTFNRAAERIFGYASEEVIGQGVSLLMPQPDRDGHDGYIANYTRGGPARIIGTGREVMGRRKDGSEFPMELAVSEFSHGDRRHFTGIVRDITDRKRLEDELRQRLHELAEADRQKNEFLAMLGHELRNPMAPMHNALHILKRRPASSAVAERAREIMERQLQQLVRLVDDLLDVSRIQGGKVELREEVIDLREPLRRGCETAQALIDAQGHRFEAQLPSEPHWVKGDSDRLSQVVSNLLTNAAKYTDRAGSIVLSLQREGDAATVRVRDTGVGIAPDLLPRVFDLFVQGRRTLERSQGGLGIGLTLVRKLVELHQGTVSAYSEGPGKGSEFVVALPIATAPPLSRDPGASGAAAQAGDVVRKVLVVDDNVDACESTALVLLNSGYDVRCLHDGNSVLATAMSWRPDAIILDIGLPGMSGLEVSVQLRQIPEFRGTPLAAVTGYGQQEDRRRSQQAGFDIHLTKPVNPLALLQWLLEMLGAREKIPFRPADPGEAGEAGITRH
jgi:two-component system, chemotaxis family, CheB/CheR fusion protein